MRQGKALYEALAREFAALRHADWGDTPPTAEEMRISAANRVANVLERCRPEFDRARFLRACKVTA